MTAAPPVNVFAALGDPARQQLLELLGTAGASTATALAGPLGMSRQAVAKHLDILRGAGLVTSQRSGRQLLFQVSRAQLDLTAQWLSGVANQWDSRLQALKRAAEK